MLVCKSQYFGQIQDEVDNKATYLIKADHAGVNGNQTTPYGSRWDIIYMGTMYFSCDEFNNKHKEVCL